MLSLNPSKLDPYISLKGETLRMHFNFLDSTLLQCVYLISHMDPDYIRKCIMEPIVRQMAGTSHGRRWFIRGQNSECNGFLVETVRVWIQSDDCIAFLSAFKELEFYRDTIRRWVEEYQTTEPRVQDTLDQWLRNYYRIRGEITESYLPLVGSIASTYGLTEDSKADMHQIGTTGLMHAVERYNNIGPVTFSSFARRWIRQRILMYISRQMSVIKVSHSVLEAQARINRAEEQSGEKDHSRWANKVKTLSAAKDVILVEDYNNTSVLIEEEDDLTVNLRLLPRKLRQIILLKHDMLAKAEVNHTIEEVETERLRQLQAYIKSCKANSTEVTSGIKKLG